MYHLVRSLYLRYTSKPEYSILLLGLDNAGKTTLLNQIKALFSTTATNTPDPLLPPNPTTTDSTTGAEEGASSTAGNTVPTVGQNVATIDLPEMYLKMWDVGGQMSLRRLWTGYYRVCHAVVFVVDSSDLGSGGLEGFFDEPQGRVNGVGEKGADGAEGAAGGGSDGSRGVGTIGRGWQGGGARLKSFRKNSALGDGDDEGEGKDWAWPKTPMTPITPGALLGGLNHGRLEEAREVLESVLGHEDMGGVPILVLANKQDREDSIEVVRIKEGFVRKVFEGEKGGLIRDSRVLPVSALKGTGVREAVEWVRSRVVWNKEGRPPVMR
ncbi:ADP-ribosylation factor-like protein 3 [Cyphellophora attinorum]|uniref:ADP-ribosylation factor-like protein 3 n=1 Tax=Cyphellophora attinorum TaxID=1664694 RepID=A0A0N1HL11_9EURO|nr:ADP-ribosylation factor-like protein 3 [Phialophora attinorum]KPI37572.1 ADP-ribosylation factor-like protein 3 [Phialophora attinorum]